MSERLDSIRRRAGKYCLLGADDALYLLRRLDRERDVVERERNLTFDDDVCNGSTSGYSFRADAEAESRREQPDLWRDACDDKLAKPTLEGEGPKGDVGDVWAVNPAVRDCRPGQHASPTIDTPAATVAADPATPDPCDGIPAHTWSGWRKGDEYSLPPLAVMLPPPPPCPTCGGQMGYVAMTVPGRPRCFRCEPEPSQWREGPPPEEFGWVWFPDDGVWPAQGLPGDTITTTRDDGILRWQHDWRWMPLETPAPPEVTP